ncbi:hypothetical protein [Mesonia maritima]|uniref:Opacity protein-like surface antigen n=1 Tax=Mesonia maritima TaxID=1793873 RepID=A0ABU1K7P6_9FLAO|nr:hypothetical protein [Mesonia maritima]MDR6301628.1 opacity protein-like surface antigen [Mesonia maritima]
MKKIFLIVAVALGSIMTSQAQEISDNAIGLRLGGGDGFGAEVSYQRAIGSNNNRLELDLGWRNDNDFDAFKLAALYQWVWNIEGGFNWYAGIGGGIGSVDDKRFDDRFDRDGDDGAFVFIAGNIGIEYNFDIPLMLSLDFRPEFGFSDYDVLNEFVPDIALGVRYQF